MRIVLINDTHFGARIDHIGVLNHMEMFYRNVFFPKVAELKPDMIIHLGDLVDRRKYINFNTANKMRTIFLEPLSKLGIPVKFITGNHDVFYKDIYDINALDELLQVFDAAPFQVFKEPTQIDNLLLMPWICDQNQEKSMEMLSSSDARFVFGHFEIQGAEMDAGTHCDHGLPVSSFSRFDRVFSGHFHQKSTLGNIEYLGAPYQMTWSDFNQLRGFHLFDTEKNDLTFFPNPYKLFHKIVYNDSKVKSLDKLLDQDLSIYSNTFSKIVVESKENPYWFDIFVDKIQEHGPLDLKFSEETILIEYGSDEEIARMIEDPIAILQKYCRSEKHGDAVEKKLTELYKAAQLVLN